MSQDLGIEEPRPTCGLPRIATSQEPQTRRAWVIEDGKTHGAGLRYLTVDPDDGVFRWTPEFDDALQLARSRDAEMVAKYVKGHVARPSWSKQPPTSQGWYWHWNGDEDSSPLPTSVLWSGTSRTCFVSTGQLGLFQAVDCDKYGGWWLPMITPNTPIPPSAIGALPPGCED